MQISKSSSIEAVDPVSIRELGYVVIGSTDPEKWRSFGEQILGMAAVDGSHGALYLKMDERDYRLAILPGDQDRFIASGWGVASKRAFEELRATLTRDGTEVSSGTAEERLVRRVQDFFWFNDPAGNRQEVFWGPISDFKPFVSPVGVSGFVTGPLGLGHVVLAAPNLEETYAFWNEKMGFGLSDILSLNFGGTDVKLYFTHCDNGRQHTLALAKMNVPNGCVHMMIEVRTLKDLGMALDRVMKNNVQMVMTLGQHVNDDCISFYFMCPGGFMFEIGWEGIVKDWTKHSVFETTLPSHWGHQFVLNDPRYRVEPR